jgi:hypothetical protein
MVDVHYLTSIQQSLMKFAIKIGGSVIHVMLISIKNFISQ